MRELYLHKEKECSQLKQKLMLLKKELDEKVSGLMTHLPITDRDFVQESHLVIAEYNRQKDLEDQKENLQQEIQTLQTLLQESWDEGRSANNEIARLSEESERHRQEVTSLKEVLLQQQQVSVPRRRKYALRIINFL